MHSIKIVNSQFIVLLSYFTKPTSPIELADMKKILVVDDERDLVQLYQIVLQVAGYTVLGATNGENALHLFDENRPDLVLLDVMMPGMDGIEVCREIRSRESDGANSTIIMYTANDSGETRDASREAGADELVSKNVSLDNLQLKISSYLNA